MADKKPKVSFKGGTPARSSTPAADEETVLVDVGGEATPVYRGKGAARLDDAAWARVKARVLPSEGDNKSLKDQPLDWPRLMQMGQNLDQVADSVVSKDQKELLGKISEWDRAEYLRQRFRNKGYDVPLESAQEFRKTLQKEPTATDVGVTKPAQGSPDEWKAPPEKATVVPSTVEWDNQKPAPSSAGRTEDDAMVGSADPGMSVRGQMARLATGATGNPMLDAVGEKAGELATDAAAGVGANVVSRVSPIVEPARMVAEQVDQRVFGDKPLIPDEVKQLPQAIGAGAATDVGSLLQWGGQAAGMPNMSKVGANLSNNAVMPPAYGGPEVAPPQGQGAAPKPAPGELPATQQPPPSTDTGGSGGASMSASLLGGMPSGFRVEKADPNAKTEYDTSRAAARAQIENAQDMQEALGIARDGAVREASKRQMVVEEESMKLAQLASQAKMNSVQEARRVQGAQAAVMEEARRAAAEPTDPNRYWNNKNEGQKAAAVIAGALFGFTGQGMQWLQRIDGLVESDMNAQRADRASKVQGLNAQASYLGQAAQQAMANGATEAEAHLLERQAKYEGLKSYLDIMSMKMTNMDQKARAAQMSAELGMKGAALGEQAYALAEQAASRKTEWNYKNAALAQDAFKTRATLAMKEMENGGGGGRPLPEAGAKLMDEYSSAVQTLREMQQKVQNSGVGQRLWQKFSQAGWTPGNADEKALYNDYRGLKYKWMTLKARGALQGIEIAALEDMLPERGQLLSDPAAQIAPMIDTADREFDRAIQQQEAAGFDMRRYKARGPTPEIPETPFE